MISRKFERNLGFMTVEEQEKINSSSIAIAGVGGDGGLLAIQMARLGIQRFNLADPDDFEEENTNRQAVCTQTSIGKNKAEVVGEYLQDINSEIEISVFDTGINQDNVGPFVEGCDLVIDETEFTMHKLGIMLARESRAREIPQMTALNIGFGAIVTTYHPTSRFTLEKQLGFNKEDDISEVEKSQVKLDRWLPYVPSYGDLSVLGKVSTGKVSAPSIAPGVALAAGVGATQATLNLLSESNNNRPKPIYAPRAIVVDAVEQVFKQVRMSRLSHYRHLSKLVLKNTLGMNPKADY